MMNEIVQWTAPSPLWEKAIARTNAAARRAELSRPGILRFASDDFMDDFLKLLAADPHRLAQHVALPETWRGLAPAADAIEPAPAFARRFKRLGLIAARRREKLGGAPAANDRFDAYAAKASARPLKLYQPAHQRFYLVAACLVCERPGLPDKTPNAAREEKVAYVVRRLFPKVDPGAGRPLPAPDETWEEYAFVTTEQGPRWKKAARPDALEPDEERQALFGVNLAETDGRRRRIFAGVIPTGRREAYMAAGRATATADGKPAAAEKALDPRVYVMRAQFRDPWKNLLQTAAHAQQAFAASWAKDRDDGANIDARADIVKNAREQIQTVSWLVLLDFAVFLAAEMPRVWRALNLKTVAPALNQAETALVEMLRSTTLDARFAADLKNGTSYTNASATLAAALLAVKPDDQTAAAIEKGLETVTVSYDRKNPDALYPKFLFPLADAAPDLAADPSAKTFFALKTVLGGKTVVISASNFLKMKLNLPIPNPDDRIKDGEDYVNEMAAIAAAALPEMPEERPRQTPPIASQTPFDMREGWFVIRCVYERPLCGALDPPVLSAPTRRFQIAGFFDPDAPARPIRIALPVDTTPAGLRKFDRNTAFMMSDLLCGQVNRMKGITFADLVLSVLPFPFHKGLSVPDAGGCKDGGLSIGMMCSLSLPIITIAALILLMIIVALLDFIFKWLPFLIFCFPLPGLKAKDE